MNSYVNLFRTFLPEDSQSISLDLRMGFERHRTWDDLRQHKSVVVLGEEGSGKSTEFREQSRMLRNAGVQAFFCSIADLASDGLRRALSPDDEREFEGWLKEKSEAYFFLDSLDEAKIQHTKLEHVLKRFEQELGDNTERAHIFISCRPSEWTEQERRPGNADFGGFGGWFKGFRISKPAVYRILPLTTDQIRKLLEREQFADLDALVSAVSKTGAHALASRPRDIKWLAEFWKKNRRIGSLRELLEHSVKLRLRDAAERGSPLSAAEARVATEKLAGMTSLCGQFSIAIRGSEESVSVNSISPSRVLESYSDEKIRHILRLALFEEAGAGRVQFYHRSAQEFLAARWLTERVTKGLSRRSLERLLWVSQQGQLILKPHLAPIAAWMASSDPELLGQIIKRSPEVLINFGDPSFLSVEDRKRILRNCVSNRERSPEDDIWIGKAGLRRFAFLELEEEVRSLLLSSNSVASRALLLGIAGAAGIRGLANEVESSAVSPDTDNNERMAAIGAIGDLAIPALLESVAQHSDLYEHDDRLYAQWLSTIYPGAVDSDALVELLHRPPGSDPGSFNSDIDIWLKYALPRRLKEHQSIELAKKVHCKLKGLGKPSKNLATLLSALLSTHISGNHDLTSIQQLQEALLYFHHGLHSQKLEIFDPITAELKRTVNNSNLVKRMLFRADAAECTPVNGKALTYAYIRRDSGLYQLCGKDLEWLADEAGTQTDLCTQTLAFDAFLTIRVHDHEESTRTKLLENLCVEHKHYRALVKQKQNNRLFATISVLKNKYASWVHKREFNKTRQQEARRLRTRASQIRTGQCRDDLLPLLSRCSFGKNIRGTARLDGIGQEYGQDIQDAVCEGLRRHWRRLSLELPTGDDANNFSDDAKIVLLGACLSDQKGELTKLGPSERKSALCAAFWNLNGFPNWFDKIARYDPETASELFEIMVREEFAAPDGRFVESAINKLMDGNDALRDLLCPIVLKVLSEASPVKQSVLDAALELLVSHGSLGTEQRPLFLAQLTENASVPYAYATWMFFWMCCDPESAVEAFSKHMATTASSERLNITIQIAKCVTKRVYFFSDSRLDLKNCPAALEKLAVVLHSEALFPANSTQRGMSDFRRLKSWSINWLANAADDSGASAYARLADMPELKNQRSRLLRSSTHAQCHPMSEKDAIQWSSELLERPSGPSDLFKIARDRIDDIRLFIEKGDHSYRGLFSGSNAPALEEDVQLWVASQLQDRSRNCFSVSREEELDNKKRTDIRLHHPESSSLCNIEIKVADRWSYGQLEDGLLKQLVRLYLKSDKSRHGIYLLADTGKKTWTKDQRRLDFSEVVAQLQEEAEREMGENESVEGLCVIGISLH